MRKAHTKKGTTTKRVAAAIKQSNKAAAKLVNKIDATNRRRATRRLVYKPPENIRDLQFRCFCPACENGERNDYPWQCRKDASQQTITDFLNAQAQRARLRPRDGGAELLPVINVISWLRDTIELGKPVDEREQKRQRGK